MATVDAEVVHIVCAFNEAYTPHFATLAQSLAESRGAEQIRITVFEGPELSRATIDDLRRFGDDLGLEIQSVAVPESVLSRVPNAGRYPGPLWYPVFLPELMPDCARVLKLDVDTVALQSMAPLFRTDLTGHVLGAVDSPLEQGVVDHCRSIGLDPADGYFNCGVLLMDLEKMREEGFTEAVLTASKSAVLLPFVDSYADQDPINVVCQGRWHKLHPRWNALSHLWLSNEMHPPHTTVETLSARSSPAIVHYEGSPSVKPWFYRSVHPLREIYRELRSSTPWPLAELQGRSTIAVIVMRTPLRWQLWAADAKRAILARMRRR